MDKVVSLEEAVSDIHDGASVAISCFGVSHQFPSSLIYALRQKGTRNLTLICNGVGVGDLRQH